MDKLKKFGGALGLVVTMLILAFGVSHCQSCSNEQAIERQKRQIAAAVSEAKWESERRPKFVVGKGTTLPYKNNWRNFQFDQTGPIAVRALADGFPVTDWVVCTPLVDDPFPSGRKFDVVEFKNNSGQDVTIGITYLDREPRRED